MQKTVRAQIRPVKKRNSHVHIKGDLPIITNLRGSDMKYEWLDLKMGKTSLTRGPQSDWPKIGHFAGTLL